MSTGIPFESRNSVTLQDPLHTAWCRTVCPFSSAFIRSAP
uniref:Uncharacterized protein n=1 Tax=Arundo donax TaxID=35708 RepID=A0A0A9FTW1_ARUDO